MDLISKEQQGYNLKRIERCVTEEEAFKTRPKALQSFCSSKHEDGAKSVRPDYSREEKNDSQSIKYSIHRVLLTADSDFTFKSIEPLFFPKDKSGRTIMVHAKQSLRQSAIL